MSWIRLRGTSMFSPVSTSLSASPLSSPFSFTVFSSTYTRTLNSFPMLSPYRGSSERLPVSSFSFLFPRSLDLTRWHPSWVSSVVSYNHLFSPSSGLIFPRLGHNERANRHRLQLSEELDSEPVLFFPHARPRDTLPSHHFLRYRVPCGCRSPQPAQIRAIRAGCSPYGQW